MIDVPETGAVIRFDKIDAPDYFGATRSPGRRGRAADAQTGGLNQALRWLESP